MNRKLIVAIPALALAAGLGLSACSTGTPAPAPSTSTSAPAPAPAPVTAAPTAASVLSSDGYTTVDNESTSQITSSFGDAAPYVETAAAGANSSGQIEVVVILSNAGMQTIGQSNLQDTLNGEFPNTTINQAASGDWIVRVPFTGSSTGATTS